MTVENHADAYGSWFVHERGLTAESARSDVSYCRRADRKLAFSLDARHRAEGGVEAVIDQRGNDILICKKSRENLQTAIRRYSDF